MNFKRRNLKMKDLLWLLRRMKGLELAEHLDLFSANISIWLKTKHIPKKHLVNLKKLRGMYDRERKK